MKKLFISSRESGDRDQARPQVEALAPVDERGPAPDPDATVESPVDRFAPFDTNDVFVARAVSSLRWGRALAGPLLQFGNRPIERQYLPQVLDYLSSGEVSVSSSLVVTADFGDDATEALMDSIEPTLEEFPFVAPKLDYEDPYEVMPVGRMPEWVRTAIPVMVAAGAVDHCTTQLADLVFAMSDDELAATVEAIAASYRAFDALVPLTVEVIDLQERMAEVGKALDSLPVSELESVGSSTVASLRAHEAAAGDALRPRFAAYVAGVVAVNTQANALKSTERALGARVELEFALKDADRLAGLLDKVPVPDTQGVSELSALFADMSSVAQAVTAQAREEASAVEEQLRVLRVRPASGPRSVVD